MNSPKTKIEVNPLDLSKAREKRNLLSPGQENERLSSKRDLSFGLSRELEIHRMQGKCKSYEKEVLRLRKIHDEEISKLRNRIKLLEQLVKRADFLFSYCHKTSFEMKEEFIKALKGIDTLTEYKMKITEAPPQLDDIKTMLCTQEIFEFTKKRRIFQDGENRIDKIQRFDLDEPNTLLSDLVYKLKEEIFLKSSRSHNVGSIQSDIEPKKYISKKTSDDSMRQSNHRRLASDSFGELEFLRQAENEGEKVRNRDHRFKEFLSTIQEAENEEDLASMVAESIIYIKRIQSTVEQLVESSKCQKTDRVSLSNQLEELELSINQSKILQLDTDSKIEGLLELKKRRETEVIKLSEQQTQQKESISKIETDLKGIQTKIDDLESEKSGFNKKLLEVEIEVEDHKAKAKIAQQNLDKIEKKWLFSQGELERVKKVLKDNLKMLEDKEKEIENIETEINQIEKENREVEEDIETQERKVNTFNSESSEVQSQSQRSPVKFSRAYKLKNDADFQNQRAKVLSAEFIQLSEEEVLKILSEVHSKLEENFETLETSQKLSMTKIQAKLKTDSAQYSKLCQEVKASLQTTRKLKDRTNKLKNIHEDLRMKVEENTKINQDDLSILEDINSTITSLDSIMKILKSSTPQNIKDKICKIEAKLEKGFFEEVLNSLHETSDSSSKLVEFTSKLSIQLEQFLNSVEGKQSIQIDFNDCQQKINDNTTQLIALKRGISLQNQSLETSLDNIQEDLKNKMEEERVLIEQISSLEVEVAEKKETLGDKMATLSRMEGKNEILKIQKEEQEEKLREENEFLADLQESLLRQTAEFGKLSIEREEEVYLTFKDGLTSMNMIQKSKLLNLLTILSDTLLSSMGIRKQSANNQITDMNYEAFVSDKELSKINEVLGQFLKDELVRNIPDENSLHLNISQSISGIFHEKKANLARLFASFLFPKENFKEYCKAQNDVLIPKEWRNALKYTANLVSYMMKTSSFFINIYSNFIKDTITDINTKSLVKNRGMKFSEEIFHRHKNLISLIKSYEGKKDKNMTNLAIFIKEVSELGKKELEGQDKFLKSLKSIIQSSKSRGRKLVKSQ